jgi:HSP20 family molecular chaperone IbpA
MTSLLIPHYAACIYPGTNVPMAPFQTRQPEKAKRLDDFKIKGPFIKVAEKSDMIQIEITKPDLTRENFHITLKAQKVHVQISLPEQTHIDKNDKQYHTLFFFKDFHLPFNADTGYASAVYDNGKLKLYFPKTKNIHLTEVEQLVVY